MDVAIVTLTAADLEALLVRAAAEGARQALAARGDSGGEEWIGVEEVSRITSYRVRYIPELVRRRGLPAHPVGRKLRFRRSEVVAWIESQRR